MVFMRVAIVYHILPHYREAIFKELDRIPGIDFTFISGGESYKGIEHLNTTQLKQFEKAPFHGQKSLMWQTGAIRMALRSPRFDAIIFLSDIHFISTWIAALIARLRGITVLFWGHGWLKREVGSKSFMRIAFYRLANHLLVYGERASRLGVAAGYPEDRISVVYNSLDFDGATKLLKRIKNRDLLTLSPQELFDRKDNPLIVCTARLTKQCRFDLLFEAGRLLRAEGTHFNILLVGDGPERESLQARATELSLPVVFFGSCHDENIISQILYHADLTVSPGKVGLTAIHSLMYGTPVVTHGDFDEQMPEAETIQDGVTGFLFDRGSAASLAYQISRGITATRNRQHVRLACREVIRRKWNPINQANIIKEAIISTVNKRD